MFYRSARWEIGVVMWNTFFAPFTVVRFRDFFFADVVTSMGVTLSDMGYSVYFVTHKESYQKDAPADFQVPSLKTWLIIASFLPFWFRFW